MSKIKVSDLRLTMKKQCSINPGEIYEILYKLFVSDFPPDGPIINVDRKQFQVGETAHLTCSVQSSSPPSQLSWFINDEPVSIIDNLTPGSVPPIVFPSAWDLCKSLFDKFVCYEYC